MTEDDSASKKPDAGAEKKRRLAEALRRNLKKRKDKPPQTGQN